MPCLWVVSEFPQMGGEAPGAAIGCWMGFGYDGLNAFLGSPSPCLWPGRGVMPRPGPRAEGDSAVESSTLLALLEGTRALDIWPCDPGSRDWTWGGRLLCPHHSPSEGARHVGVSLPGTWGKRWPWVEYGAVDVGRGAGPDSF